MRKLTTLGLFVVFSAALLALGGSAAVEVGTGKAAPGAGGAAGVEQNALPKGPVLTGEDGRPIAGVGLAKANVEAVVDGELAEAAMTLTFANDTDRVLGGELVFPLPEGVTVSGYALDINGVMVEGVAVEKQRARIIYEQELHKRVDPGLVEHVAGNAFRTRLYPVPAHGQRTIRVRYLPSIELAGERGDGPGKAALVLPIGWSDVIDQVGLRVELRGAAAAPIVAGAAGDQPTLRGEKRNDAFVMEGTVPTKVVQGGLTLILPPLAKQSASIEKRLKAPATLEELDAQAKGGEAAKAFGQYEHYFAASDAPTPAQRQPAKLGNRLAVVWDASLSRADVDHGRELKLLEALLAKADHPAVDLVIVRNDVEVEPRVGGGAEGTKQLVGLLKGLTYDGATNLGAVAFPASAAGYGVTSRQRHAPYDFFLFFTDGMGNLGSAMPRAAEAPVYAIAAGEVTNGMMLRSLCQQSGGAYFNLKGATDEQVLAGVGDLPFSFISAEFKEEEVADLYPAPGEPIRGRFTLSGKLLAPEAKVTVHYGYGKEITQSQTFTLKAREAKEGALLPRYWAQQKVAHLSLMPEQNQSALEQIGKAFNLVTPNTSLLVLETADQYVQHRVVPPKDRPDVYKEFLAKIEQNRAQVAQSKEQKIQQVAAMWQARVNWWEAEHRYPPNFKAPKPNEEGGGGGAGLFAGGASGPPVGVPATPRSAPAPEPSPAPPSIVARTTGVTDAPPRRPLGLRRPGSEAAAVPAEPANAARRAQDVQNLVEVAPDFNLAARGGQSGGERGERGGNGLFGNGMADNRGVRLDQAQAGHEGVAAPSSTSAAGAVAIRIKPWDPQTPYLKAMKAVAPAEAYGVYLEQRKTYGRSPAFYLDAADYLVAHDHRALGVRVLTDIAEMQLEDARLLRVAAHRLLQIGESDLAIDLFEKVLKLRPEEPQSHRDLALALADRADGRLGLAAPPADAASRAVIDYGRAVDLLNQVVMGSWPRFPEIEVTALMEANRILATLDRMPNRAKAPIPLDSRLRKNLDLDVRIVMTWDADQTDIDLWVTEPSGEKCFYGHNRTVIGGLLSRDFTDGYGPEEYCLRKLMPGENRIQANYYGSRQQELPGPATVQATVITNFGRPDEKRQALTLRLGDRSETVLVGTIRLGPSQPSAAPAGK